MANNWGLAQLEGLVDEILDRRGVTPLKLGSEFKTSGHRVISAKLVKNGRLDLSADEPRFVDSDTYQKWMRTPLYPDDVLLTSEAPLGEVSYVTETLEWCLGQRLFCIRTNKAQLDGRFLFYALQSSSVRNELASRSTGTTVQGIRQSELRKIHIPLPPLIEQQAIANILAVLDDKIDLNRRNNETLDVLARAMFKDWFVDFAPVRAKSEGRQPYLAHDLWSLFPSTFNESGLPQGWHTQRADSFFELAYGKALKASDRLPGMIPVYGSGGITGYHNEALVDGPSVIVGRKGTVGSLYWEDRPFFPIDTVFYVVPKVSITYCFYLLQTLGLEGMNTDAAVPGLNRNNVYRLDIVRPSEKLIEGFSSTTSLLHQQMLSNRMESETITQLRDILLPRLLSGDLRVRDAERLIERTIT